MEAAIQSVTGVAAVEDITIRRRGWFDWREFTELCYDPGKNVIIRIANDPQHPERGTIKTLYTWGIMSCNCGNQSTGTTFPCLCDQFIFPPPLNIGAGLSSLPRQIATFPEFRRAMLLLAQGEEVSIIDENNVPAIVKPLANWRARDKDDLGIMLLEMWAYVCDSLSFYDEVIADEVYVRTCTQRNDLRRLVALLGYLPRPAVGSLVKLAALADGRLDLKLPAGTAFSSGAFDGNPPQIFELDNDTTINSLTNQWDIISPHVGKIVASWPDEFVVAPQSEIKEDNLLLLVNKVDASQNQGLTVQSVVKYTGIGSKQYTKLAFTTPTNLLAGTLLSSLRLLKAADAFFCRIMGCYDWTWIVAWTYWQQLVSTGLKNSLNTIA